MSVGRSTKGEQVFVVLRLDPGWSPGRDIDLYLKAVEVLPSEEQAMAEVARLTRVNAGKAHYFWQSSKWYSEGREVAD
jgi:hypothetical protein